MNRSRALLPSIAKKGSNFDGLQEVVLLSSILPVAFLSSLGFAFSNVIL